MKKMVYAMIIFVALCFFNGCDPQMPVETAPSAIGSLFIVTSQITEAVSTSLTSMPADKAKFDIFIDYMEIIPETEGVLYPYWSGEVHHEKWGYVNKAGVCVVQAQYSQAWEFKAGYGTFYSGNNHYIINSYGQITNLIKLNENSYYGNELQKNNKYYIEIINILEPDIEDVYRIDQEYLYVKSNGKSYLCDTFGNLLFPYQEATDLISIISKNFAICYDNDYGTCVNVKFFDFETKQIYALDEKYNISDFIKYNLYTGNDDEAKLFPVECDGKIGYVNQRAELVVPIKYIYADGFYDGCAVVVTEDEKCSYIDEAGNPLFDKQFEIAHPFSEGVAAVSFDRKTYGYIDKTGEFVIDNKIPLGDSLYAKMKSFSDGMAAVSLEGNKYGYMDKTGELVIPQIFDGEALFNIYWEGFIEEPERAIQFRNGYVLGANFEEGWAAYYDKTGIEIFRFPVTIEEW